MFCTTVVRVCGLDRGFEVEFGFRFCLVESAALEESSDGGDDDDDDDDAGACTEGDGSEARKSFAAWAAARC